MVVRGVVKPRISQRDYFSTGSFSLYLDLTYIDHICLPWRKLLRLYCMRARNSAIYAVASLLRSMHVQKDGVVTPSTQLIEGAA